MNESGSLGASKTLKDLVPYTNYSCFGIIKAEGNSTVTTNEVNVRFDCGTLSFKLFFPFCHWLKALDQTTLSLSILTELKIVNLHRETTNTTIQLNWDVKSDGCSEDVLQRVDFDPECSCGSGLFFKLFLFCIKW